MNSTTEIHRCKSAFVLQRYFRTFAANPSDSISDVVIQMHFLSLYKGRICVYSTRTDFKHNSYTNSYTKFLFGSRQIFRNLDFLAQNRKSYTNSYTYSYTRFLGLEKIYEIFKNGLSNTYRQVFKVAGGIKFRIFNCRTYQNSYTYSDTKLSQKQQKTATEALLLRFCCGATGNRTRDTRIFSPLLYQLSYGTRFSLELPYLSIGIAKVDIFSLHANLSEKKSQKFSLFFDLKPFFTIILISFRIFAML